MDLIQMRQIPQLILYKPSEPGNYHMKGKMDARAGRFAVSRTIVNEFNFSEPYREELEIKASISTAETFKDMDLLNAEDINYGI